MILLPSLIDHFTLILFTPHNLRPLYIPNSSMEEILHPTTLDQKPIMNYMCCGYENLQHIYASQASPRPLIAPFIQILLQAGNSLQKHNKSRNVITHLHYVPQTLLPHLKGRWCSRSTYPLYPITISSRN